MLSGPKKEITLQFGCDDFRMYIRVGEGPVLSISMWDTDKQADPSSMICDQKKRQIIKMLAV